MEANQQSYLEQSKVAVEVARKIEVGQLNSVLIGIHG